MKSNKKYTLHPNGGVTHNIEIGDKIELTSKGKSYIGVVKGFAKNGECTYEWFENI